MAGKGISALAHPPRGFRVDAARDALGKVTFETRRFSAREDSLRAALLANVKLDDPAAEAAARTLARQLAHGAQYDDPPQSLASSLFMRDLRIRVGGALWQLHSSLLDEPAALFTIVPKGHSFTVDELPHVDPRRLEAAVRSDLNRAGAGRANGALIAFIHGEFDPSTGRYQLHWHGMAIGEMIEVVDQLRSRPKYKCAGLGKPLDDDGVYNRVRIDKRPITNIASRLSYLLKSFWPSRASGLFANDGKRRRRRHGQRIPDAAHSAYLLWLDKWRIEDITLMIKVRVVSRRLRVSNGKRAYTNGGM